MTRTPLSKPQEKKLDAVRAAFKDEVAGEHAVRYDSSDLYDFEAALTERRPPASFLTRISGAEIPTEDQLRKHARRFGRECVSDVADAYGLDALAVELREDAGKRRRPTSPALKEQARALRRRGLVPAAIADVSERLRRARTAPARRPAPDRVKGPQNGLVKPTIERIRGVPRI